MNMYCLSHEPGVVGAAVRYAKLEQRNGIFCVTEILFREQVKVV
jgi:hypothetical protein